MTSQLKFCLNENSLNQADIIKCIRIYQSDGEDPTHLEINSKFADLPCLQTPITFDSNKDDVCTLNIVFSDNTSPSTILLSTR